MIEQIKHKLKLHSNKSISANQCRYMKNQFQFYGIQTPLRKEIIKPFLNENQTTGELMSLISNLANGEYREEFLAAIDFFTYNYKKFSYAEIKKLYKLIEINSWWDSVDALQKPFSLWSLKNPEYLEEMLLTLNNKELFWYKRLAILLQLKHKSKTDTALLSKVILYNKDIKEFFIQKAIGWVLREYSKTDSLWVLEFLSNHKFSPLVDRESRKYINQKKDTI